LRFKITIISGKESYIYYEERTVHNIEDTLIELREIADQKANKLFPYKGGKHRGDLPIHIEEINEKERIYTQKGLL
jgi:hypothetical protein